MDSNSTITNHLPLQSVYSVRYSVYTYRVSIFTSNLSYWLGGDYTQSGRKLVSCNVYSRYYSVNNRNNQKQAVMVCFFIFVDKVEFM